RRPDPGRHAGEAVRFHQGGAGEMGADHQGVRRARGLTRLRKERMNKPVYAATALIAALAASPALAQNVKITPLGSHEGELCANDRATLFEDPTGVRILYDVGHTVT